ncbi:hypothetical protein I316_00628 [Kwoniella heveanensis BCC8398]|uniref:DUF1996 domain-containing protein n=1 Tax=Kwoniella heveanensis BCC8398 TaxID=1296120 RepID=A0A1B9H2K5_9TREE|nr:hypothetical protein I316_00628 [Kwoniella heveanensis BCC8398]
MKYLSALVPLLTAPLVAAMGAQYIPAIGYDNLLFTEDFFPLIRSRLDPIVDPGKVSGHVHMVAGSSAFAADMTYATAQSGSLYYKWKNGTYSAVMSNDLAITAYWKYPLTNTDPCQPFANIPDDFRMLAGNIKRDDFNPANASNKAVEFLCIDANGSYDYTGHMPTDRECLTLRPQLHFPEYWNGVDSFKEGNSHVAYPVDGNPEGGVCPEGFFKIPHLFLETTYHINADNIAAGYEWYPGCFVMANGDDHGYSFHADWLNGFPSGFLVDAFQQCFDASTGLITKDCQVFHPFRGDNGHDCKTEGDVVNEIVGQNIAVAALPGSNPEFNSSKYSENYPKQTDPGYTEQASLVKASDQTGGFCLAGICTDYTGSDVVGAQQPLALPAVSSAPGSAAGVTSSVAIDGSNPVNYPSATAITSAALGQESVMSILPVGTPSVVTAGDPYSSPPAVSSSLPGLALVAGNGTESDSSGSNKICQRRRKRRVTDSRH